MEYKELYEKGFKCGRRMDLSLGRKLQLLNMVKANNRQDFAETLMKYCIATQAEFPMELLECPEDKFGEMASAFMMGIQSCV